MFGLTKFRYKENLNQKKLIFIAGQEGSGTTMLLKFLSQPSFSIALGGLYYSKGFEIEKRRMNKTTDKLWNISKTLNSKKIQKLKLSMGNIKIPPTITHIVYKRSFPYTDIYHFPNITDLNDISPDSKTVVIIRSPIASVASIIRRRFTLSVKDAAERIKKGVEYLISELNKIDKNSYIIISYEKFIADPNNYLDHLEKFIEFPKGSLAPFVSTNIFKRTKESVAIEKKHEEFISQYFQHLPYLKESREFRNI